MLAEQGLATAGEDRIGPRDGTGPAPLSAAQRRMWFMQQLQPESAANNVCVGIRLTGELDVPAFRRALLAVIGRHEVLRTVYLPGPDGAPVQQVCDEVRAEVPVMDFGAFDAEVRERMVDELALAIGGRAFDLSAEPPLWLTLLRMHRDEHVLLLVAHHIAWDDASWAVFLGEVARAYRAELAGATPEWSPLPVQVADHATWEQSHSGEYADALAYWRERLGTTPAEVVLPWEFPRPAKPAETGGRRSRELPGELAVRVRELCRAEGVTPFMLLLAAFTAVLRRYSGSGDVTVGSPVELRENPELSGLIGAFGNLLVLRTDATGAPTFRELLARVRSTCTEAFAHQELPFDTLVERLRPERAQGRSVLFDVMFSVRSAVLRGFELPGVRVTERPVFNGTAQFDLSVATVLGDGGAPVALEATYRTELFTAAGIDRLLGHVETLLRGALEAPERPVSELPLLAPGELGRLLDDWNATEAEAVFETV